MTVSDADVSEALLVSTLYETYPESDEVLTTDLAPPALEASLQLINKAKHQTEVRGPLHGLTTVPLTSICEDRYSRPQSI